MISGTFHSLWTSRFLSGVIFLLPQGHMVLSSLLVMNTFSFCMFEKLFILPSWLKDTFAGFRIMGFWFFFFYFPCVKDTVPLSFVWHCFLRYCYHLYWCSSDPISSRVSPSWQWGGGSSVPHVVWRAWSPLNLHTLPLCSVPALCGDKHQHWSPA